MFLLNITSPAVSKTSDTNNSTDHLIQLLFTSTQFCYVPNTSNESLSRVPIHKTKTLFHSNLFLAASLGPKLQQTFNNLHTHKDAGFFHHPQCYQTYRRRWRWQNRSSYHLPI